LPNGTQEYLAFSSFASEKRKTETYQGVLALEGVEVGELLVGRGERLGIL
jgi:hypothetical protein